MIHYIHVAVAEETTNNKLDYLTREKFVKFDTADWFLYAKPVTLYIIVQATKTYVN
jgi:hypothetical protein